jgi:hypothetical protein
LRVAPWKPSKTHTSIHLHRQGRGVLHVGWHLSFLGGWRQIEIESLDVVRMTRLK